MIRQPSSIGQLYRWHHDALAGRCPEIHDGIPECGWFKMRRVKGGPWVPVEITCESVTDPDTGELTEPEKLIATVEGQRQEADRLWTYLHPISRDEFTALVTRHRQDGRMAATMVPMNLSDTPQRPPRRHA